MQPMAPAPAPTTDPGRRPPLLWPWVVTLIVGIALAAAGVGLYVAMAVIPLLDHHGVRTPATMRLHLSPGTYDVYQAPIAVSSVQITPSDVRVFHVDTGSTVPARLTSSVFTLTSGGVSYQGYVEFTVTRAGTYVVRVRSPGGFNTLVFVAPSLTSALTRGLGYLGLVVAGFLVAVLGLVMLIVRAVQRSRRRPVRPQGAGPLCANGHPVARTDRFCATCGAPVYAAQPASGPG